MIGESVSMTGTWMQVMAQGWVMTSLTSSAFVLGLVNFAAGIPALFLSLLGGTIADRHDKRLILLVAQIIQMLTAFAMGFLIMTDQLAIWHVFVIAFVVGCVAAFEMPSAAAIVPELVKKEEIGAAIAMDRAIFHGTRLIGPALAGMLIGWMGSASAFFVNGLTFIALGVAVMTLPKPKADTAEEAEQRKGGIREGWEFVKSDRMIVRLLLLLTMVTVFVFPIFAVMMPLYARETLGLGPSALGILMACSGVGSLTGSIGLLAVSRNQRLTRMRQAALGVVVGLAILAIAQTLVAGAIGLVLTSLSISTLFGLANTTIQERAPGPMRGRVSSIAALSFTGLMPFAALGVTGLADFIGMRPAIATSCVCFFIGTTLVLMSKDLQHHCATDAIPPAYE